MRRPTCRRSVRARQSKCSASSGGASFAVERPIVAATMAYWGIAPQDFLATTFGIAPPARFAWP